MFSLAGVAFAIYFGYLFVKCRRMRRARKADERAVRVADEVTAEMGNGVVTKSIV